MNLMMNWEFIINVNNKTYDVKVYADYMSRFKIETDREYLFTLSMNKE